MDPLSATASAFAFVGACRKLVNGLRFLKEVSRAPEDILALTEELHDLQNTLTAIGSITRKHQNDFVGILLTPLFHRVDHVIRELCGICRVCPDRLKDVEDDVDTDQLKFHLLTRVEWTREKRRVGELRERLKVVRLDFANSLGTVSMYVPTLLQPRSNYFTRVLAAFATIPPFSNFFPSSARHNFIQVRYILHDIRTQISLYRYAGFE